MMYISKLCLLEITSLHLLFIECDNPNKLLTVTMYGENIYEHCVLDGLITYIVGISYKNYIFLS